MVAQFYKSLAAVAVASTLALCWAQESAQPAGQAPAAQPAQAPKKEWKDRAEYDLVQNINRETDGQKKLALLDQWKEKYPNTDFKVERLVGYIDAYRLTNQPQKMWETAQELLREDPNNVNGHYWITLLVVSMGNTSPENLAIGEKSARALAENVDQMKPATASDADWQNVKQQMKLTALGHRALGWIALQRKNNEESERQLAEYLKLNPNDGEAAAWMGTAILQEKRPERQGEAIFYFARAAAFDGPGALDPARRQKMMDYVQKAYTTYHGNDPEGLKQLLATARTNAIPPAGFTIPSEAEMKEKHLQQLSSQDPQLAFWVKLKEALQAPEGEQYFDSGMKGALIPPEDQQPFRGTVVSQAPVKNPKEVVLGIQNPTTPEVTLRVDSALPGTAEPGTVIQFRGVAAEFQKDPFMVTFDVERKNIRDWPSPAPAAKKATPKKGAAKRKR